MLETSPAISERSGHARLPHVRRLSTLERSICVYCASSESADPAYREDARRLGAILAARGLRIVYGGGAVGSMGALAAGALAAGGRILGVLPRFMMELEWGHQALTELRIVEDMRIRKHIMLTESHGVVALPGGPGTLEELFEALTLKRLGLYTHPIGIVNTRGYFDPLLTFLAHAVAERFMGSRHLAMWQVVATPQDVPAALDAPQPWPADAHTFATVR
jgi:hypothetical protein